MTIWQTYIIAISDFRNLLLFGYVTRQTFRAVMSILGTMCGEKLFATHACVHTSQTHRQTWTHTDEHTDTHKTGNIPVELSYSALEWAIFCVGNAFWMDKKVHYWQKLSSEKNGTKTFHF